MNYTELIQTSDWKNKRSEVLIRDGKECKRCGIKHNFGNTTHLLRIQKETLQDFQEFEFLKEDNINVNVLKISRWNEKIFCKTYLNNGIVNSNIDYCLIINFVNIKKIKYPFQGSILGHTKTNFFHNKDLNSFLSNLLRKNQTTKPEMEIDLEGIWFIPINEELEFTKSQTLEVHHKCYRENTEIWNQVDNEYVTLCNICHRIVHESTQIPFYDINGIDYKFRKRCERCNGLRYLKCYNHYKDGICFKCNGQGYTE